MSDSKNSSFVKRQSFTAHLIKLIPLLLLPVILSSCTAFKASDILSWGSVPNERGVLALKDAGFKTIVNFRTNSHKGRAKFARAQGIKFVNIHTGVFKTPEEAELKKYLDVICDPANQPVYVSCNIGIDRTSYYVAAYRIAVQGWTIRQATDEMLAHGLKQWWPTFIQYKDSLTANEAFMRRIAREHGCANQFYKPTVAPCPCHELYDSKTSLLAHKNISPVDSTITRAFDTAPGPTADVKTGGGAGGGSSMINDYHRHTTTFDAVPGATSGGAAGAAFATK